MTPSRFSITSTRWFSSTLFQRRWPPGASRAGGASPLRRPSHPYACSFFTIGWQAPALEAALDTTMIVLISIALALIVLRLRRQALTLRVLGGILPICGSASGFGTVIRGNH
jgi:hypothetical protein